MLDIDDRLRSSAQTWQRAVDDGAKPPAAPRIVRSAPRPRARLLAPAFSVLGVLIVAAGVVLATRPDDTAPALAGNAHPVTYGDVTFHLPHRWDVQAKTPASVVDEVTDGSSVVMYEPTSVWSSNASARCAAHVTDTPCQLKVTFAPRDGTVVFAQVLDDADQKWNTRVAGQPARRDSLQALSCVGADREVTLMIRTGQTSTLHLQACFGHDSTSAYRQFAQVLRTATHN